ncbi:MAG TPA: methyltransferase domain-containing protein [Gallionella sp.]|nr:methyltransferase domain-containing protein [Gallionella sp.]
MDKDKQTYRTTPMLRWSYSLIAPLYDFALSRPLGRVRAQSLESLPTEEPGEVLLSGIGTGLDLPLLPDTHRYTALDFNAAMLSRAISQNNALQIDWVLGDSMALPFDDERFDHVVLHLILAVVPHPERCLSEAARVLKPGGTIVILDKFLRPQQQAWLRRAANPLSRRLATRLDVVFEEVHRAAPELHKISDVPLLAGGWFRGIVLRKPAKN